ncbi:MAG TPA: HPF/RaiA family ribosome-associated protein [Flavobacterium sp.]|jgi:ribosome-associated translation inhibitor RaiA
MLIQIHTDNHIEGYERMEAYYSTQIEESLKRFSEKITSLQVHLGDENSDKFSSDDKKCTIEARIAGVKSVAVVNHADTIDKAVNGAVTKMKHMLETTFDKMKSH